MATRLGLSVRRSNQLSTFAVFLASVTTERILVATRGARGARRAGGGPHGHARSIAAKRGLGAEDADLKRRPRVLPLAR
jgi:hypothetical protein